MPQVGSMIEAGVNFMRLRTEVIAIAKSSGVWKSPNSQTALLFFPAMIHLTIYPKILCSRWATTEFSDKALPDAINSFNFTSLLDNAIVL
jgi:hypothetical protein